MQLTQIKHETCPTCSAETVADSRRHRHCNGQGFEERVFGCGCTLAWSPNFERLEVTKKCPKHPEEAARIAKRMAALDKLAKLIASLDVDKEWMEQQLRNIKYI